MDPLFKANVIIKGKIECKTGLHIGGSKDKLEIGGVDTPVIRNPQNRQPYIPGSSLKGKMRSLLEYGLGVVSKGAKKLGDVSQDDAIVRLFGIGANEKETNIGPTRLIVRDCNPDKKTIDMWEKLDSELLYTEYKPENTIDRVTAAANPRFVERVVAGSFFDFEMVYSVFQMSEADTNETTNKDLNNLLESLRLLEHSTLGGSGSRGYGKIKFHILEPVVVRSDDYKSGEDNYIKAEEKIPDDLNEFKSLSEIDLKL